MNHANKINKQRLIICFIMAFFSFSTTPSFAMEVPIEDFSMEPYTQEVDTHIPFLSDEDYSKALLTPAYQQQQLKQFYNHTYASDATGLSPWSEHMVRTILPRVNAMEQHVLAAFNNQNKPLDERHYAENFKEHDSRWWDKIKQNMRLSALNSSTYNEENRAIAITNTFARALPDRAPDFFHASLPGQGFPFDNLQDSAIWSGTPLYVLHTSEDNAWVLVLTPDAYISWVRSDDIAYASNEFILQWQTAAQKNLVAITKTEVSLLDAQQHFQLSSYIGAVFPLVQRDENNTTLFIPKKDGANQAIIKIAIIPSEAVSIMPLSASKKNIANLISKLQNRPYGWGGSFFFNDCSQEIKSLFTPLGIWLPRNSAQQAELNSGIDLSTHTLDERLNTLKSTGHPLMTLIYLRGHVMLYVGNETLGNDQVAMTYQNLWGLSPQGRDKRYVVGQSVFLPLLKRYPENPDIDSLANKSMFKLIHLDELSSAQETAPAFAQHVTAFSSKV